jgi:hypothetical protein
MPSLSDLKEKAEELCPYRVGKWHDTRFDRRAHQPDSAWASCLGYGRKAVVSVMLYPPKNAPQLALIEPEFTIPLLEPEADVDVEQLELFEGEADG